MAGPAAAEASYTPFVRSTHGTEPTDYDSDAGPAPDTSHATRKDGRRGFFATTSDVRSPEHLQRLLATIETLKEESGENVQKLKSWLHEQQQELQAWIKKHQPIHTRRLEAIDAVLQTLLGGEGDLLFAVESLMRVDEVALLSLIPLLCDAVVLETGHLTAEQRASLRSFLLAYAGTSQHAALHVCWYLRAMGTLSRANEPQSSPNIARRSDSARALRRGGSTDGSRVPASVDVPTTRALSLLLQLEAQLEHAPLHAPPHQQPIRTSHHGQAGFEPAKVCGSSGAAYRQVLHEGTRGRSESGESIGMDRLAHLRQSLQVVKRLTDLCATLTEVHRDQRVEACRQALARLGADVGGAWLPVASLHLRNHALQAVLPSEATPISTNKHCPVILHLPVLIPDREAARAKHGGVVGDIAAWAAETAAAWSEKVSLSHGRRTVHLADELENPVDASLCQNEHSLSIAPPMREMRPMGASAASGDLEGAIHLTRGAPAQEMVTCARQLCDVVAPPRGDESTTECSTPRDSLLETPRESHLCSPCSSFNGSTTQLPGGSIFDSPPAKAEREGDVALAPATEGAAAAEERGGSTAAAPLSPLLGPVLPLVDGLSREGTGLAHCEIEPADASVRVRLMFGELWDEKEARICSSHECAMGGKPPAGYTYRVLPCIVKTGEPLLQEQFAIQLVRMFQDVFDSAKLPLRLHAYSVVATSPTGGLVQLVTNSSSIDALKRNNPTSTLLDLFCTLYGPPSSREHRRAIRNFCNSCAAWAVVCYFLQIKDRHNGNILLHANGHIVHIDFGFMLTNSPGGNLNFESAPFKLTSEYVQLMGGARSQTFLRFRDLVIKGFLAARKHASKIISITKLTLDGAGRDMPCFVGGEKAVDALRARFQMELNRRQYARHVDDMVTRSLDHWSTTCYDKYQRCMLGIM